MSDLEAVRKKYESLRFNSMAMSLETLVKEAETSECSYLHFAGSLVDKELKVRENNRISLNMKRASFPVHKYLEDFDFSVQTTITKKQINRLLDFTFVDNRENVVFIGPPGVGKTHLSISIGIKAVEKGYRTIFTTALELNETLELAEMRGELKKKINSVLKADIVIIDELGYLPLNKKSVYNFFQLINALYEYRTLILTTNKEFSSWGEFFINDNLAVPIVDRIIHKSHIFMLGGESYRLKQKIKE